MSELADPTVGPETPPAEPAGGADTSEPSAAPDTPEAPAPSSAAEAPAASGPAAPAPSAAPALRRPPRSAETQVAELERAVRGSKRPAGFIARIHAESERLAANAAGRPEMEALVVRLAALEQEARAVLEEQIRRKTACCEEAEELRESSDWKATKARYEALLAEWKSIGSAGREHDQALWQRFQAAKDTFFTRRSEDLARRADGWRRAQALKEEICARADALASSTEWKKATEELTVLMEAWKAAGSAGRDQDQALWARFSAARAAFFEHRGAHHKQQRQEHDHNRRRKEELCAAAEQLTGEPDVAAACESVKRLQAEWKTVGPAPHDVHETLWIRFRTACNLVFERARGEREQRHAEWVENLADAKRRKEDQQAALQESIERDRGHVERWRATIANLRDDWRSTDVRTSLEAKIADVEERLGQKQSRLEELTATLARITAKLEKIHSR